MLKPVQLNTYSPKNVKRAAVWILKRLQNREFSYKYLRLFRLILHFWAMGKHNHVAEASLHEGSLIPIFRSILTNAGVASADLYSGHSLRRGFANWATANGWDLKTLMAYVGWKNVQSAMRYVDASDPFSRKLIESHLALNNE